LKLDLAWFAFYFSFDCCSDVLIFDHIVLIKVKSYFGVDHGGVEVGSCKGWG